MRVSFPFCVSAKNGFHFWNLHLLSWRRSHGGSIFILINHFSSFHLADLLYSIDYIILSVFLSELFQSIWMLCMLIREQILAGQGEDFERCTCSFEGFGFEKGIDPLRSSLLQPQKSFMQSSQQYNLQMLPPQQQQRLLMQAHANSNLNDVDSRRIQMLLNRNAIANKDGQPNAIGDVTQKVGSPMQSLSPMARPDMEMLLKMKMAQMQLLQQQQLQQQQQQQRQQLQHEEGNNQHSQVTSHQQQQDDKVGVANGTDGSVSDSRHIH